MQREMRASPFNPDTLSGQKKKKNKKKKTPATSIKKASPSLTQRGW
jgi:hypothetical protein